MDDDPMVQGFTVHMLFSAAGAYACAAYARPCDRIACMFAIDSTEHAQLSSATARVCVVNAAGTSSAAADGEIDYTELVRWCAEAERVVSWR